MWMHMNAVDVVLLVVVVLAFLFGLIRGFVMQLVQIASLVVGLLLASKYYVPVAEVIRKQVELDPGDPVSANKISSYIAMFAIFMGTVVVLFFVSYLARDLIKQAKMASFDRLLGGVFGAVKGLVICSALYYGFQFLPADTLRKDMETKLKVDEAKGVPIMKWIIDNGNFPKLFKREEEPPPAADAE